MYIRARVSVVIFRIVLSEMWVMGRECNISLHCGTPLNRAKTGGGIAIYTVLCGKKKQLSGFFSPFILFLAVVIAVLFSPFYYGRLCPCLFLL